MKTNESRDEDIRIVGLDLSRFKGKESGGRNDPVSGRIQDQGVVKVIAADLVTSCGLGQAEKLYWSRTRKRSEGRFFSPEMTMELADRCVAATLLTPARHPGAAAQSRGLNIVHIGVACLLNLLVPLDLGIGGRERSWAYGYR